MTQEFDQDFVNELARFVVQYVQSEGMVTIQDITSRVRISGISKVGPDDNMIMICTCMVIHVHMCSLQVELSADEIDLVLNTLVYDGRLEEVSHMLLAACKS